MTPDLAIRAATAADLPALHALIERCYRGTDTAGWTNEAALFDGPRTDLASLSATLSAPGHHIIVALADTGTPVASVQVSDAGDGIGYLSLLCVDPDRQATGIARTMIAAAEALAVARFGAHTMEMTVIDQRATLLAYYQRRGYALTGELRPLPPGLGQRRDLDLLVLQKPLPAAV